MIKNLLKVDSREDTGGWSKQTAALPTFTCGGMTDYSGENPSFISLSDVTACDSPSRRGQARGVRMRMRPGRGMAVPFVTQLRPQNGSHFRKSYAHTRWDKGNKATER